MSVKTSSSIIASARFYIVKLYYGRQNALEDFPQLVYRYYVKLDPNPMNNYEACLIHCNEQTCEKPEDFNTLTTKD